MGIISLISLTVFLMIKTVKSRAPLKAAPSILQRMNNAGITPRQNSGTSDMEEVFPNGHYSCCVETSKSFATRIHKSKQVIIVTLLRTR